MFSLSLLPLAGLLAVSLAARIEPAPLSDAQIEHINSIPGITWKAGRNFYPKDMAYIRQTVGDQYKYFFNRPLKGVREPDQRLLFEERDLPKNFDAREKWPKCETIREIGDVSGCGASWAFGSGEAINDRICVATGKTVRLSALDIISCCGAACGAGSGCQGGYPDSVWKYWVDTGVVTGGAFNSSQGCKPYPFPTCNHYVEGPGLNCSDLHIKEPECVKKCVTGYPKSYKDDIQRGGKFIWIDSVEDMMQQIYTYGPITTGFDVYEDFLTYKSGVYKHVSGADVGGRAVRIIGWGVENGVDYWLCANSWNTNWGDKGLFKIAKGVDECHVETSVFAGYV